MGNLGRGLFDYLWQQGWQMAVLVLIVAGVCMLLRHRSSHLRYMIWLVVLAKALVPPLFTFALPILPGRGPDTLTIMEPSNLVGRPIDQTLPVERMVQPTDLKEGQGRIIQAKDVLAWIWLTGAATLGCVIAIKAVRLHRLLVSHRTPLPKDLQESIEAFQSTQGLSRPVQVWVCPDINQPLVWGLYRGQIYLPSPLTGAGLSQEQRMVLAHEVCHVLRFDPLVNGLQILVQLVYWFHPLVWWANRRIRVEREKCCDEMVIARMHATGRDYSQALLNTLIAENTRHMALPSLAVAGPLKSLEERIGDLMRRKTFHARPSLSAMAVVLLLTLIVVPSSVVLSRQQAATEPSSSRPQVSQVDRSTTLQEFFEPTEEMVNTRAHHAGQLRQIGVAIYLCAEDHDKTLPDNLKDVRPYCDPNLFQWALANVEYTGKGLKLGSSSKTPMAFDRGFLLDDQGTWVLFTDGHLEYRTRSDLGALGFIDPNARFQIAWSILQCPQEDETPMAFLKEHSRQGGRRPQETSAFFLSSDQGEQFRHLASPQAQLLSSPRATVGDRQRAQCMMANREWSLLLDSGPEEANQTSDPCRPAVQKVMPAIKLEAWCAKGDGDVVVTHADWGITDELPRMAGTPKFPVATPAITRHRTTSTVASHLGDWVVVPGTSRNRQYFVMWQVTTPDRPTADRPGVGPR